MGSRALRGAFGIPLIGALAVGVIGTIAAWRSLGAQRAYGIQNRLGPYEAIDYSIKEFLAEKKRLPTSLGELPATNSRLQKLDYWGNPIEYRVEKDGWTLTSLGRDGKPGGTGLDADYTYRITRPADMQPTLWQFLSDREFLIGRITPWLAALVLWLAMLKSAETRGPDGRSPSMRDLLIATIILGALAVFGGLCLAAIHLIPSGH
jgi:hypothetical protein